MIINDSRIFTIIGRLPRQAMCCGMENFSTILAQYIMNHLIILRILADRCKEKRLANLNSSSISTRKIIITVVDLQLSPSLHTFRWRTSDRSQKFIMKECLSWNERLWYSSKISFRLSCCTFLLHSTFIWVQIAGKRVSVTSDSDGTALRSTQSNSKGQIWVESKKGSLQQGCTLIKLNSQYQPLGTAKFKIQLLLSSNIHLFTGSPSLSFLLFFFFLGKDKSIM